MSVHSIYSVVNRQFHRFFYDPIIRTFVENSSSGSNHINGNAPSLEVAIVGGGIVGVMTALGLGRRGIKVVIYERASTWTEVSAGFAFTEAARRWMKEIDPALIDILERISQKTDADSSNSYWDGYTPRTKEDSDNESKSLLFRHPNRKLLYWGCVRSQFLKEMGALLPEDTVVFGKQLLKYDDDETGRKVTLHFEDGTTAEADVLLGCDGVHSSTRKTLLGEDHPASRPGYSHNVTYRTMVPFDVGVSVLGEKTAETGCMQCGPNANLLTYPVMGGTLLNIAVFAYDPKEFPEPKKMTVQGDREEIKEIFKDWSPHVSNVWKLYPEKVSKWGIHDMTENPPPTYARGRACIVGDAAHASTPFLGIGACTGVEDALVVCKVLESVHTRWNTINGKGAAACALVEALQSYSRARMERGQWVSSNSLRIGKMYQWRDGQRGKELQRELAEASQTIVAYDVLAPLKTE
ncbi:putative salicylate hydroxylase [Xylariaceae sp. FL0255]|nr:putative salicylate hydroxylase [Xylariaceae sp. FL0255]